MNMTQKAMAALDDVVVGFANVMDRAKIGRKVMLYMTLWLTWTSYSWATTFAFSHADKPGIEIAAVVGAILLPISYLQKSVFDSYLSNTKDDDPVPAPGDAK